MEQIKELLEILKQTPEMALWGLAIYFTFILLKLASWVSALAYTSKLSINRYFDAKEKKLDIEKEELLFKHEQLVKKREYEDAVDILKMFEGKKISRVSNQYFLQLLDEVKGDSSYIHEHDIIKAIKTLKGNE